MIEMIFFLNNTTERGLNKSLKTVRLPVLAPAKPLRCQTRFQGPKADVLLSNRWASGTVATLRFKLCMSVRRRFVPTYLSFFTTDSGRPKKAQMWLIEEAKQDLMDQNRLTPLYFLVYKRDLRTSKTTRKQAVEVQASGD